MPQSHTEHAVRNVIQCCTLGKLSPFQKAASHLSVGFFFNAGQESKHTHKKANKNPPQYAVYPCDTPITLKQCQGHQAWNRLIDPEQGCNHAKFERPHINSVCEKTNMKVFLSQQERSMISLEYNAKKKKKKNPKQPNK